MTCSNCENQADKCEQCHRNLRDDEFACVVLRFKGEAAKKMSVPDGHVAGTAHYCNPCFVGGTA